MGYNLTQINPAYELVGDVVVGTATTTVDFTGLNITKDDDYMLVGTYSSANSPKLYINNNTVDTNYYCQYVRAASTTIDANRFNAAYMNISNPSFAFTKIRIKLTNNGYFVYQDDSTTDISNPLNLQLQSLCGTSTFTATLITSIRLSSTGINAGSRFQLYKRVAPIIADITVSTATTSIDFTGLSIDKDSEYMLVGTYINSSANNTNYAMYVNGNNTSSNYYTQRLYASSTTVGASRYNDPLLSYANNGTNSFNIANIKLTNNGYMVVQSNISYLHGTSLIEMRNQYITSTFTINSITSIRIESATNAIGIGSRFQLIKLK